MPRETDKKGQDMPGAESEAGYGRYFEILRKNDAPIGHAFCDLNFLQNGLEITKRLRKFRGKGKEAEEHHREWVEEVISYWRVFKKIYDEIDLDEQDGNTGKGVLAENKELIDEYHRLFMPVAEKALAHLGADLEIPSELPDLKRRIWQNMTKYQQLPAVRAYDRAYASGKIDVSSGMTRSQWFKAGKPRRK